MWQDAQAEANKANEARFQDIMGMYGGEGQSMWDLSSQFGQGERRRISQGMKQAQGQAEQDLISRGLGGTTVRSAVRRGIRSSAEDATQDLEDRVARQRMDIIGGRAGVTERRTDAGPDAGLFAQMMMGAANQPTTTGVGGAGGIGGAAGRQRSRGATYNFPPGWYDQFSSGGSGGGGQAGREQQRIDADYARRQAQGQQDSAFQAYIDQQKGYTPGTGQQRIKAGSALAEVYRSGFKRQQQAGDGLIDITRVGDAPQDGGFDLSGMGGGAGVGGLLGSLIPGGGAIGAGIGGILGGLGEDESSWGTPQNLLQSFSSLFGG